MNPLFLLILTMIPSIKGACPEYPIAPPYVPNGPDAPSLPIQIRTDDLPYMNVTFNGFGGYTTVKAIYLMQNLQKIGIDLFQYKKNERDINNVRWQYKHGTWLFSINYLIGPFKHIESIDSYEIILMSYDFSIIPKLNITSIDSNII